MINFNSAAAIVVHWGDSKLTNKAVCALLENSKFGAKQIFVVENGMSIDALSFDTNVIRVEKNKGYAAGVNRGIKEALGKGFESFFVMNNDLECPSGVVEPMLENLSKNERKVGCLGAVVNEGDGRPVYGGGKINWFRGRTFLSLTPDNNIDYVSGAFFLVSKKCFLDVGPMPEEYFHTWEDVAYSFQVKNKGWEIGWIRTPIIEHPRSQSMKDSKLKTYYLVRNGVLFMKKYAPAPYKQWFMIVEPFREKLAVKRKKWEVARAIIDARKGVTGPKALEADLSSSV